MTDRFALVSSLLAAVAASCWLPRRPWPARRATRCCRARPRAMFRSPGRPSSKSAGQDAIRPDARRRGDAAVRRGSPQAASRKVSRGRGQARHHLGRPGRRAGRRDEPGAHRTQRRRTPRWRSRSTSRTTSSRPTACWPQSKSGSPPAAAASRPSNSGGTTLHVFTVPADAGSPPQDDRVLHQRQRALRHRRPGRSGCDAQAIRRQAERQSEIRRRLQRRRWSAAAARPKDLEPEARWFVEPFGFIFAARTLQETNAPAERAGLRQDSLRERLRRHPGRRAGSSISSSTGTSSSCIARPIYAPPVPARKTIRCAGTCRCGCCRLPNVPGFEPQSWVPRMSASYATFQLEIVDAFDNFGPLFDAMQDHKDAWAIRSKAGRTIPTARKVDVRKEFVANMGQRITIVDRLRRADHRRQRALAVRDRSHEREGAGRDAGKMDEPRSRTSSAARWASTSFGSACRRSTQSKNLQVDVPGFTRCDPDAEDEAKKRKTSASACCPTRP